MSIAIASFLSLFSAVVVALIGHAFAMQRNRKGELAEMRIRAYTDFINSTSRLAAARRAGSVDDEVSELAILNDAKARICVCAPKPVVEQLIAFWNAGGTLEKELEILAFTRFCLEVRASLGNARNDVISLPISDALFKLTPSNYSFRANGNAFVK